MLNDVKTYLRHGLRFCRSGLSLRARPRDFPPIAVLMYHEVLDDQTDIDSWMVVRKTEFRNQMEYLKSNYEVLSLKEALATANNRAARKRQPAVVTFDDGYSGNAEVALPVMKELNIPFTLFCATEAIENQKLYWYDEVIGALLCSDKEIEFILKPSDPGIYRFNPGNGEKKWSEIQRLLAGLKMMKKPERDRMVLEILEQTGLADNSYPVRPLTIPELKEIAQCGLSDIGAHSHTHDILVQLDSEEAERNIKTSQEKLRDWTGRNVECFSYPNGEYNSELRNTVKDLGFKCAFTTEERRWTCEFDLFSIPRIGIGRFDNFREFKTKLSWAP